MSFWRKSIGSAAVILGHNAATRALGVVSSGLIARLLTPAELGSLQAVNSVSGTLFQLLKFSLDSALQVRLSESIPDAPGRPGRADFVGTALLATFGLGALALLASVCFAGPLAHLFGDPSLQPLLGYAGVLTAAQQLVQMSAVLLAFGHFNVYGRILSGVALLYMLLLAAAYALGVRGLMPALVILLFTQALIAAWITFAAIKAWRGHGITARFSAFGRTFFELSKIGVPVYASAALLSSVSLTFQAKLADQAGIAALVDLRLSQSVSQLVTFVPAAMAQTFLTHLAAARGSDAYVPVEHFLRYTRLIVVGSTVAALGVGLVLPMLVPVLFGSTYRASCSAIAVGMIATVAATVRQCLLTSLLSERRSLFAVLDMLITSGVFALGCSQLITRYGSKGFLLADLFGSLATILLLAAATSIRLRTPQLAREGAIILVGFLLGLGALAVEAAYVDSSAHWLVGASLLLACTALGYAFFFTGAERAFVLGELTRARARFGLGR